MKLLTTALAIIIASQLGYKHDLIDDYVKIRIVEIDSLEAYYLFVGETTKKNKITILSLKNYHIESDSLCLEKIQINKTYDLRLEKMSTMFLNKELTESVIFPHQSFYVEDRLISTLYIKPYVSKDIIGSHFISLD